MPQRVGRRLGSPAAAAARPNAPPDSDRVPSLRRRPRGAERAHDLYASSDHTSPDADGNASLPAAFPFVWRRRSDSSASGTSSRTLRLLFVFGAYTVSVRCPTCCHGSVSPSRGRSPAYARTEITSHRASHTRHAWSRPPQAAAEATSCFPGRRARRTIRNGFAGDPFGLKRPLQDRPEQGNRLEHRGAARAAGNPVRAVRTHGRRARERPRSWRPPMRPMHADVHGGTVIGRVGRRSRFRPFGEPTLRASCRRRLRWCSRTRLQSRRSWPFRWRRSWAGRTGR
jgi:hypothetical protein